MWSNRFDAFYNALQDINNEIIQDEIIATYDEMNNKSNHPLEKDDEPPPLPPPRGESLTRSMMTDLSSDGSTDNGISLFLIIKNCFYWMIT